MTPVFRSLLATEALDERRAAMARGNLGDFDVRRVGHLRALPPAWELRHTLTPYAAAYVDLAELLDTVLVTADQHLGRAPGPRCLIERLS